MNWRFTFNQNNSGHSKKEIFDDYEQKYLKKLNKIKSEIQKIQNKQKEIELNELKDRIARRLKLEKKSGKNSDPKKFRNQYQDKCYIILFIGHISSKRRIESLLVYIL